MNKYRVIFSNTAEATVQAKNRAAAFKKAKKRVIDTIDKSDPDRKQALDSMAKQTFAATRIIVL